MVCRQQQTGRMDHEFADRDAAYIVAVDSPTYLATGSSSRSSPRSIPSATRVASNSLRTDPMLNSESVVIDRCAARSANPPLKNNVRPAMWTAIAAPPAPFAGTSASIS